MNQCVDELTPDFTVDCRGSDKCLAKIRHPVIKVWVYLGTFSTPEEARDVCSRKKLEYESCSVQEVDASLASNTVTDYEKHPGIKRLQRGKWGAVIRHNMSQVSLGRYDTPNEAAHAYNLSKLELESQEMSCLRKDAAAVYSTELGMPKVANKRPLIADAEKSEKPQRPCSVYRESMSNLELDSQENGCSRKNIADYSNESGMPKAVNKGPLEAGVEPFEKHQRSSFVYQSNIGGQKIGCMTNVSGRKAGTVDQDNSGKRKAEIQLRKIRNKLSTFDTAEALVQKKYELGGNVDAEQNQRLRIAYPRSGRWRSEIRHPITKANFHLGTFDTAEEAQEAYHSKRLEFDLMLDSVPAHAKCKQSNDSCDSGLNADAEHSEKSNRRPHAYQRKKSGRWTSEIKHPSAKNKKIHLGTFDTAKQAEEAYNKKRREFDLMFPGPRTRKQSNNSSKIDAVCVDPNISPGAHSAGAFTEDAEEAHNSKMGEFDLMLDSVPAHMKCKQSNDSCDSGLNADAEHSEKSNRRPHAYYRKKSGRWTSEIRHPSAKNKKIHLGTFDTAKQAEEAYIKKRQEFDLMFPGHKTRKQSNNSNKIDAVCVDPYISPGDHSGAFTEDTEEAHNSKMGEFDLMLDSVPAHTKCKQSNDSCHSGMNADAEHSEKSNRRPHAYQRKKSGRWVSEIRHPSAKNKKIHLGTFDTDKQAEEAYNKKRQEFDLMFPGHRTCKQSNNSSKIDAVCIDPYISPGGHSGAFTEEAEEAHNSKMGELDLMGSESSDHEKRGQLKASCEADEIGEGRSDPNCAFEDPSVSADGSSVVKAGMVDVKIESVSVLATERSEEFDLGIIDSYGRLIGEYCSLDDELWIC